MQQQQSRIRASAANGQLDGLRQQQQRRRQRRRVVVVVLAAASAARQRRAVVARAAATPQQQEELEEVDPMTGEVIGKSSAMRTSPGFSAAGWSFRRAEPKQPSSAPRALFLHGLGSSSVCFRATISLLGDAGFDAAAADWPGHGGSAPPAAGACTREAWEASLDAFVRASGLDQAPFALAVHGYVLPQYALGWALKNEGMVDRLLLLNTPLAPDTKLRPELAAYGSPLPFLRPKADAPFDAVGFAAAGQVYALSQRDAEAYASNPVDGATVARTLAAVGDWPRLLRELDDGFRAWRRPTIVIHGQSDPFISSKSVFQWLDSKRTTIKAVTVSAKVGAAPTQDYPEALTDTLAAWLRGDTDGWEPGKVISSKMTKKGLTQQ